MADFALESGHWYKPDGTPAYTIQSADGTERPTTLRDARKHKYLPSVTGIIGMAARPGLEWWIRRQLALACLTLPRLIGESEDAFLYRAEQDARKESQQAADRGTKIHGAIERYFRGEFVESHLAEWAGAVEHVLFAHCGRQFWLPERSFACLYGYGGKVDLHSADWTIDFKGKDGNLEKVTVYDEHKMQLAAYRYGLGTPTARAGILFFDRNRPHVNFVEVEQIELARGLEMFLALLKYWQIKNNYFPSGR